MPLPFFKKKAPPPESAYQPPELLDDAGEVAFSPQGPVEIRSDVRGIPGTFAAKDSKHRPLPNPPDKKAVFLPDGTKGIVKSVGDTTLMALFPAPFGLLHVYKRDCWNPEIGPARRRWARAFTSAEDLARFFHETYERLAPEHGYETKKESAVPWEKVPGSNKNLMIAVAGEVLKHLDERDRNSQLTVESRRRRIVGDA